MYYFSKNKNTTGTVYNCKSACDKRTKLNGIEIYNSNQKDK